MTIFNLAIELAYWQQTIIRSVLGLVAVLLPAGTLVYLYLFKMMSFMQSRLGPMEAGPYGSLQLLAEENAPNKKYLIAASWDSIFLKWRATRT